MGGGAVGGIPATTQILGAELGRSQGSLLPVPCVFTGERSKLFASS